MQQARRKDVLWMEILAMIITYTLDTNGASASLHKRFARSIDDSRNFRPGPVWVHNLMKMKMKDIQDNAERETQPDGPDDTDDIYPPSKELSLDPDDMGLMRKLFKMSEITQNPDANGAFVPATKRFARNIDNSIDFRPIGLVWVHNLMKNGLMRGNTQDNTEKGIQADDIEDNYSASVDRTLHPDIMGLLHKLFIISEIRGETETKEKRSHED